MQSIRTQTKDGITETIVARRPTEDVIVRASIDYTPQFVTDVYGQTDRVTKDVTMAKLLRRLWKEFPEHELVSIGTPVNFDVAPTHLTRVEMDFKTEEQVEQCLKEIAASDMMIRSRIQPAWSWDSPMVRGLNVILHVGWYDTLYFMQFKDIFLGALHCRYSAKFGFDPKDAKITHFRYDDHGDLEPIEEYNRAEQYADSIKDKVEYLRVFRDGTMETT